MTKLSDMKTTAERELNSNVTLEREIPFEESDCVLMVWRSTNALPTKHIAILGCRKSQIISTRSMDDFSRFFKHARPPLDDLELLETLVSRAAPPQRAIATSPESTAWVKKHSSVWHAPTRKGKKLVFFCNDFLKGQFEKFEVSEDYDLTVSVIGPGKRVARR